MSEPRPEVGVFVDDEWDAYMQASHTAINAASPPCPMRNGRREWS